MVVATVALSAAVACGQGSDEPTPSAVAGGGPGGIAGIVTDLDGAPVAGMRVGIVSGTAAFPEIAPETDQGGSYQINSVPPGTFQVGVHDRDGQRIGLESVVVKSGETASRDFSVSAGAAAQGQPAPIDVTSVKSGEALTVSEQLFLSLLTPEDVEKLLATEVPLTTAVRDFKEMAGGVDPAQVVKMDSWFGLTIDTASDDGMTFTLIDFDSRSSARAHYEKMRSEAPPELAASFGDTSYRVELNAQGIGSMLTMLEGDKLLSLHTVKSEGRPALVSLEDLEELARLVLSRL